jgi:hypothetical protein
LRLFFLHEMALAHFGTFPQFGPESLHGSHGVKNFAFDLSRYA